MVRTLIIFITVVLMLTTFTALPAPALQAQSSTATDCPVKGQTPWIPPSTVVGKQVPCPWKSDGSGANLGYLQYLPADYATGSRFPLVVFFHGKGERGNGTTDLYEVSTHGPPMLIKNGKWTRPAIVISPQVFENQTWTDNYTGPFVNYLLSHYKVDLDRVYITGLSLGSIGTWVYARKHADKVAAAVPISGADLVTAEDKNLSGMPIWAFHEEGDTVAKYSNTVKKLEFITGVNPEPSRPNDNYRPGYSGGFDGTQWNWRRGQTAPPANENPILTTYEGSGHSAWGPAYDNQAMWDWLFAQRRQQPPSVVFQQDFQRSTVVGDYVAPTNPDQGQFNDISAERNGGTWTITQGRLQLVRTGSGTANSAGITRHTDFVGAPSLLHVAFDLGISNWTISPFQSDALVFSIGNFTSVTHYAGGEPPTKTFQSLSVKGEGAGWFALVMAGGKSRLLAADGTMHRVQLFLNKRTTAVSYRAPNGNLLTLRAGGAALWVGTSLVIDAIATNGSESSLTDMRMRFSKGENATWQLDNVVIRSTFPQ